MIVGIENFIGLQLPSLWVIESGYDFLPVEL